MSPVALPVEMENWKQPGCSSKGNWPKKSWTMLNYAPLKTVKATLADLDGYS